MYTLPCRVGVSVIAVESSYTPLGIHSFLNFNSNGVSSRGTPFALWICNPIVNVATPKVFIVHGMNKVNALYFWIEKINFD